MLRRFVLAALASLLLWTPGHAGDTPGHAGDMAFDQVEASLTVALGAGTSTYRAGELIPLELTFQGRGSVDHYFSTETTDRSGRLATERYVVTPAAGVEDPLADYLTAGIGLEPGTHTGFHPLGPTPWVLHVYLNEWVRFTQPGTYELVVVSERLRRHSGQTAPELRADPLTIRIEPATPEWATAEVARAVAAIERRDAGDVRRGIAMLRHLGTREAALALVEHYSAAQSRFDVFAGLIASPSRTDIVEAMEARLDTGRTLPQDYIRELAILQTLSAHPPGELDTGDWREQLAITETEYRRRWLDALMRRMALE